MTTEEFNRHAAARRADIANGILHPASLIGLAQDRLRRIAESRDARPEWRDQLFPAHAGMNRRAGQPEPLASAVPRTRGDEPAT